MNVYPYFDLNKMDLFKAKTLLITGGTGSFGDAILRRFLKTNIAEIRVFSRDEEKQDLMRKRYNNPKLKFYIGDIRDYQSLIHALKGVDYVFHAAALKQVPSCEFYPMEAVKTNILGTENVLEAAFHSGVSRVVCLSTDKAVYPINAMGMSKAMMEKVMVAKSRNFSNDEMIICGARYGNVMASRGSVIPLFINQIMNNIPLSITEPSMTRFMMTLDEAVELAFFVFLNGSNGDIFVQKAPAATIEILAKALLELVGQPDYKINLIGTRHGEKLYETLLSREEVARAEDLGDYFRIAPDLRDLNYSKFVDQGEANSSIVDDYNSHNTHQLSVASMKKLLLSLEAVKALQAKFNMSAVE